MFTDAIGSTNASNNHKVMLRFFANRCQQPDYPPEMFLTQSWTSQLLYPHLPKRLVDMMPANIGTLYSKHAALVETERRFVASPEFGLTDPPLAAFNKAQAIYTSVVNTRNGSAVDPAARHRPIYGDDEGKPPVVIRGTQLWPAEAGAGYRYDDLRCAWGFADDVIKTFDEERNASISSRGLKLRHILSWLGGYNSKGATIDGTLKAFAAVVRAYGSNVSEIMRPPLPSVKKDEDFS